MIRVENKIKGIALIILGMVWVVFVYNFDNLMKKPTAFGTKAVLALLIGLVAAINGMRIYRRK